MAESLHQGSEAPAAGGGGGLPQFDAAWWPGEIVWFCAIFLVVFLLMKFVFVPRVGGTMAEREDRIAGDIARARALKDQAEAQAAAADADMAQARGQAQKVAAEAKARVQAAAAVRQSAEETKLAATLAEAEASIRAARDQAMGHVREIARDTAQVILAKLTGKPATAAELKAALEGQG